MRRNVDQTLLVFFSIAAIAGPAMELACTAQYGRLCMRIYGREAMIALDRAPFVGNFLALAPYLRLHLQRE